MVLAGAPSELEAQRGQRQGRALSNSLSFLLEKSEDLGLSDQQVSALTTMRDEFQTENEDLLLRVRSLRGSGDRDAMRETMMELREKDQAATDRALELLDDAQQAQATALLEERRANRRRPPGL